MVSSKDPKYGFFFMLNDSTTDIFKCDSVFLNNDPHFESFSVPEVDDNVLNLDLSLNSDARLTNRSEVLNDVDSVFKVDRNILNDEPDFNSFSVLEIDCNDCILNADTYKPSGFSDDIATNDDVSNVDCFTY